jgi:hypothetical protein
VSARLIVHYGCPIALAMAPLERPPRAQHANLVPFLIGKVRIRSHGNTPIGPEQPSRYPICRGVHFAPELRAFCNTCPSLWIEGVNRRANCPPDRSPKLDTSNNHVFGVERYETAPGGSLIRLFGRLIAAVGDI